MLKEKNYGKNNVIFKKSLLTIATISIFAGSALGLEVGDKMPNLGKKDIAMRRLPSNKTTVINYYSYSDSKKGSRDWEYASAVTYYQKCGGETKPFAIQSFEKKEIYVDSNCDGRIDSVYRNAHKTAILRFIHTCKYQNKRKIT